LLGGGRVAILCRYATSAYVVGAATSKRLARDSVESNTSPVGSR